VIERQEGVEYVVFASVSIIEQLFSNNNPELVRSKGSLGKTGGA